MNRAPSVEAPGAFRRFFDSVFRVRPDEFAVVQAFFLYGLSVGMLFTLTATTGDALFLSRLPRGRAHELVPWLSVGVAAVSIPVTAIYARLQERFSMRAMTVVFQAALAASMACFNRAIGTGGLPVLFALNVWLETAAALSGVMFFAYLARFFTGRDARRIYPYVIGSLSIGGALAGWSVKPLVGAFGAEALVLVCGAVSLAAGALAAIVSWAGEPLAESGRKPKPKAAGQPSLIAVLSEGFPRTVLIMALASSLTAVVLNYQLKVTASEVLDKAAMAVFFGRFYLGLSLVAMGVQFFAVNRLIGRVGVIGALLVTPAVMIVGSLGFLALPALAMTASVNFARLVLTKSLYLPCRQMLLLPLQSRMRLRAQTLVSATTSLGRGAGGLLLLGLARAVPEAYLLSPLAAGLAVLWAGGAILLGPRYQGVLSDSIRKRQFDPADLDSIMSQAGSEAVLRALLEAPEPELQLSALGMIKGRPLGNLADSVEALAVSPDGGVAVEAIGLLGASGLPGHLGAIRRAVRDPRGAVRGAAIGALYRIEGERAVPEAEPWLDSEDIEVRACALVGAALHGGFEGTLLAYPRIDALLKSRAPADRGAAARILARIGGKGTTRALSRLLMDPDRDVRREALAAARELKNPDLLPRLLDFLGDLKLRPLAAEAIGALPREAAPLVAEAARPKLLGEPESAYVMRVLLPERLVLSRALGHIGGAAAAEALWEMMASGEELLLRLQAGHALKHLMKEAPAGSIPFEGLMDRVELLCRDIGLMHRAATECGGVAAPSGKGELPPFGDGRSSAAGRLFWEHARLEKQVLLLLLSFGHDVRRIRRIETHLFGADRLLQANAAELLETSLPRGLCGTVVPLLTCAPPAEDGPGLSAATARELVEDRPWVRALAHFHFHPDGPLPEAVAGRAVGRADAGMRKLVMTAAALRRVALFEGVMADELSLLAEIAEERSLEAGEVLFREGEPGDALHLVSSGRLGLTVEGRPAGELKARMSLGEEDLLERQCRSVSAAALDKSVILRIGAGDFMDFLDGQPRIARTLLGTMAARLRALLDAETALRG